ncbi:DNA-3-methyladenine glycosylase I [Helcobacillus massiliensis]|uniref:DNA-3-methyladenine glycosylase I n=1 Tax=Helcobacillus massiliensis TaxID=521392 RepID=UPI002553DC03|nr:DNA-3-methyladenine glycosylase I [Helcobacillus massiliensis]MDK7742834.1 DNA-3-methyladenine glycosylase I [Helcobacillus massiliensis]
MGRSSETVGPVGAGPGLVVGADGCARPPWATANEMLRDYYDTEWGMPVRTEQGVFERLSLEGFQAGLSWATILTKRAAFRRAFHDFDVDRVAQMGEEDIQRLLSDAAIIRHRGKIAATVTNARIAQRMRTEGTDIAEHIWSFQPALTYAPRTLAEIPTQDETSRALSRDLKGRGFRFVGPTTMFALMEAIGLVDTHLVGSHRRGASGLFGADGSRR